MTSLLTLFSRQKPAVSRVARFATKANNAAESTDDAILLLVDALRETHKSAPPQPSNVYTSLADKRNQRNQVPTWKAFRPNSVLRPHEITYKARERAGRPPLRRPAVGPPSAAARYTDVFHQFNIDPLTQAQNPAILARYLSEMGKVYGRNVTGLTVKSQRRMGKAIRRAKMMGVIPILSAPRLR